MVDVGKTVAKGKAARTGPRDHHRAGTTDRGAAQENVEQLRAGAAACTSEGRDNVEQVERSFAQYVREQPLKSILIAAGIGMLLGGLWMRR